NLALAAGRRRWRPERGNLPSRDRIPGRLRDLRSDHRAALPDAADSTAASGRGDRSLSQVSRDSYTSVTGGVIMRKIVAGLFISLDNVIQAPDQWHFPYFNDEMGQEVGSQMAANDTMLLGRKTYEMFAGYWPQQPSDVEPADYMNNTPKVVVSNTL